MALIPSFLLFAGVFSLIASILYLQSIIKKKHYPLLSVFFIWSVTSFWVTMGYFAYKNSEIWPLISTTISSLEFKKAVGLLAGIIILLEFVPYIHSILKGRTKPERATWFIWNIITTLGLFSYYSVGGHDASWVIVAYVIATAVIAILSIKYGVGGWNKFDKLCIAACGLCLLIWMVSGSAVTALAMTIAIDAIAALPTVRKTYYHPEQEDRLAWVIALSGNGLNLLAIERWDFMHAAYPLYLFFMVGVITEMVLRRRHRATPSKA